MKAKESNENQQSNHHHGHDLPCNRFCNRQPEQQLAEAQSVAKHEADCAEAYKAEADELRKQLAEREKQIVMLRGYLEQLACLGNGDRHGNSIGNDIAIKALSATADLSGCIICDAEPVAKWKEVGWSDIPDGEPLYKARTK